MRSHRRRAPVEHALIVGGFDDLAGIVAVLGLLPADAYGQVIVETGPDDELPMLCAPLRVTVQQVIRRPGDDSILGRALAGWTAEWLPEEPDPARLLTIWVGAQARAHVDAGLGDLVEPL